MTDQFSDRLLVAGTINGLRAFSVDRLGRLGSPQQPPFVFKPGENLAKCPYSTRKDHRIGELGCSCGFYAYHDGNNAYHTSRDHTVAGMIEGYGTVSVGDKGFRAEKCKIVALVDETKSFWYRLDVLGYFWLIAFAASVILGTIILATGSIQVAWGFVAIGVIAAIMHFIGLIVFADDSNCEKYWYYIYDPETRFTERQRIIQRNYPDVPIYKSTRAMLKEHPLTQPPEYSSDVSPETHPNFWEMKV